MINRLFKRVLAYCIDMLLVSIVVNSIGASYVNPQYDKYIAAYNNYLATYNEYYEEVNMEEVDDCSSFQQAIIDEKLTNEEYVSQFTEIKELLENKEITTEEYDGRCLAIIDDYNSNKMTEEEYVKKMNNYCLQYEKNLTLVYLLDIIICILYFVFFQKFTDGQTLGKKIMRIKVISNGNDKLSYKNFFLRIILLYSVLYELISAGTCYIIPANNFMMFSNVLYILNNLLLFIIALFVIFNKEHRGPHDLIANTRVVELDFKGNIKNIEESKILEKENKKSDKENKKKEE